MSCLFVIGGVGFIGFNFVYYVVGYMDYYVIVFDVFIYVGNCWLLEGFFEDCVMFVEGDIIDVMFVDQFFVDVDVVVYYVVELYNDNLLNDLCLFFDMNIIGMYMLFEVVCWYDCWFYYIFIDEVYGDFEFDDFEWFIELILYNLFLLYLLIKVGSDLLVCVWVCLFGVQVMILNCLNNYGFYQYVEKFIFCQIINVFCGICLKFYGVGENVCDWIYVDDYFFVVFMIFDKGVIGEMYLIGVDGEWNNKDVVELILMMMGQLVDVYDYVMDCVGYDLWYVIDLIKLCIEFGWCLQFFDFEVGLLVMIDWYCDNELWWVFSKDVVEVFYVGKGQ